MPAYCSMRSRDGCIQGADEGQTFAVSGSFIDCLIEAWVFGLATSLYIGSGLATSLHRFWTIDLTSLYIGSSCKPAYTSNISI